MSIFLIILTVISSIYLLIGLYKIGYIVFISYIESKESEYKPALLLNSIGFFIALGINATEIYFLLKFVDIWLTK
jgi:hypothetical protein